MTILVVGGAGKIGSMISRRLLMSNFDIICMDNFDKAELGYIKDLFDNNKFVFYNNSIKDNIGIKKKIHIVLNCSGKSYISSCRNVAKTHSAAYGSCGTKRNGNLILTFELEYGA